MTEYAHLHIDEGQIALGHIDREIFKQIITNSLQERIIFKVKKKKNLQREREDLTM